MDEDRRFHLVGLGPERIESTGGQIFVVDVRADRAAAQPEFPDAFLQLGRREVGVLQAHGGEPHESIRIRRAALGQLLVLLSYQPASEVPLDGVPKRIDAEHFDIDAHRIHFPHALRTDRQRAVGGRLAPHDFSDARNLAVRVKVHGPDALAADDDLSALVGSTGLRVRTASNSRAADEHSRDGACRILEERSAIQHGELLAKAQRAERVRKISGQTAAGASTPRHRLAVVSSSRPQAFRYRNNCVR